MTPKEYAQKLVEKYKEIDIKILFIPTEIECKIKDLSYSTETAKQCAIITINEIIDFRKKLYFTNHNSTGHKYLLEIKTEIENL